MSIFKPVRCLATVLGCCLAAQALGQTVTFEGHVRGDDGSALAGAVVTVNEGQHASDTSGAFRVEVARDDVYALKVSADGYYSFIHSYSRADAPLIEPGDARVDVPTVVLVEQRQDRRLLVFGGDAMMGRRFVSPRASEPVLVRDGHELEDMQAILRHVRPYLELADMASVNLETQLSDTPLPEPLPKSVTFLTHPAIATALAWAGVDYVALGNNHTYDFQEEGLARTLAAIADAGLAYSGAGVTDAVARRPANLDLDGLRVSLYSYVGWRGRSDPSQVAEATKGGAALGSEAAIREDLAGATADAVDVFQFHSGLEYVSQPPLAEETALKLAIDAGADLAIGHHSHVLQGFEVYRGKLLAYSLGNFVFDQYLPSTHASMLVYAWFDGDRFYRAEIVPMHVNGYVPTPATGRMRYDILQRLARLSRARGTCLAESGVHLTVHPCDAAAIPGDAQRLVDDGRATLRHVETLGARPVPAVASIAGERPYRVGVDMLRRGDFEYVGLFDTDDRSWIDDPAVVLSTEPRRALQVTATAARPVRTGMRVFTRVFTRSNPATLAVTLSSDACANVDFLLQRRPDGVRFDAALETGPTESLGRVKVDGQKVDGQAQVAELDFQLPRTFTRSVRLLIDVQACENDPGHATVWIDDLAIVEWRTPWLDAGRNNPLADVTEATHVQFRTP